MGCAIIFAYDLASVQPMETIGTRIRDLRKRRGLNQTQLAAALGIDQSTVSDIERGAGFSADILMRLMKCLSVNAEFIMLGASSDRQVEAEALALLRGMDVDRRDAALDAVRGIASRKTTEKLAAHAPAVSAPAHRPFERVPLPVPTIEAKGPRRKIGGVSAYVARKTGEPVNPGKPSGPRKPTGAKKKEA